MLDNFYSEEPGNSVFYNKGEHFVSGLGAQGPSPAESLPTIQEARFYFKYYLTHAGRQNVLMPAIKNALMRCFVVDLDLDYFNLVRDDRGGDECANETPFCTKPEHLTPKYYAESLAKALTYRPLVYLSACEQVLTQLVYKHIREKQDEEGEAGQAALVSVGEKNMQINLLKSSRFHTRIRELLAGQQEKFVVIPGLVVQISRPTPKLEKAVYQCRFCSHVLTQNVSPWRENQTVPSFCEFATKMRQNNSEWQDLPCRNARDPYFLLSSSCSFVDNQLMRLQELPEDVPTGDMPRQITLDANRYLCEKFLPGTRVLVHGVLTTNQQNPRSLANKDTTNWSYAHVLGIRMVEDGKTVDTEDFSAEEKSALEKLARDPDIHQKIFKSIAPALYGMEKVKMATAAVLFGGTRKQHGDEIKLRGDIHMLMLGDPSLAKSQLLKFADRTANISVYTSGKGCSAAGLTAAVVRDKHGIFSLEGGAMVLADGGLVCIDEFDKMRSTDVVAIHEAMEQQTISISKAGITTLLNARCSVIAAANPTFGSYDNTRQASEQHDFTATLLSRFDLIFLLHDKEDENKDAKLCQHILSLHAQQLPAIEGLIPLPLLRRYVQYARHMCHPRLSKDGIGALKNYFVNARQEARANDQIAVRKIGITIRQLESLVRISESFAKMELAQTASQKHVQMALALFAASTLESCKANILTETLSPVEQKAITQAENAIMTRLNRGNRVTRQSLLKELVLQGYDASIVSRSISMLIQKKNLLEKSDKSLKKP